MQTSRFKQTSLGHLVGILRHVNKQRQIQLFLVLAIMIISGIAEAISITLVIPFLNAITNPEYLWQQTFIKSLGDNLGLTNAKQIVIPLAALFASAVSISTIIKLINLQANNQLSAKIGFDISREAYKCTLYQAYEVHLKKNSSSLTSALTIQIKRTVNAISAMLGLITSCILTFAILMSITLVNWRAALSTLILIGLTYYLITKRVHHILARNSREISKSAKAQIKRLKEGSGGIRDIILSNNQDTYLKLYCDDDWPKRKLEAQNKYIAAYPKYLIEAIGIITIALFGSFLALNKGNGESAVALIGAFAIGAQKLLPETQKIYRAWAIIKGTESSQVAILELLNQKLPKNIASPKPLVLNNNIRLEGIHFSYTSEQREIVQNLDLNISRGEKIGLIGKTGSGKSTLIDIFMGLLKPTSGKVLIDGENLYDERHPDRLCAWRISIAHVPQNIYLTDSSIAENIAFGVPQDQIDITRVKQVAEQAQIARFIESRPDEYNSLVGECGIQLSGGQRQRIGIARALYKQVQILILDEATSALDSVTEATIMQEINKLDKNMTIIIITHRLNTVKLCDRILALEKGKLVSYNLTNEIIN